MGLSNKLFCVTGSFSHNHNPHRFFSVRGFEALFPCTGTLGCVVCLAPQLFLLVYPHTNVGPLGPPCHMSSPPQLPISAPPSSLNECFFFNSFVVEFPYSLILYHFWLFFVFKFGVVLLLVVGGGKVYLPIPPS